MEPSIPRRSRKRRTPHRTSTAEEKNGGGRRRRTIPEKDEHGGGRARRTSMAVSLEQSTVMDSDAPYLPEEIFTNILKRLPVKSLIRFQCVCKDWKNLFKTPSFIAEHNRHSTQQDSVLLFKRGGRLPCNPEYLCLCLINRDMQVLEYQTQPSLVRRSDIIGSSNGLLCLVYETSFILWNPATREVIQLPNVPNPNPNGIRLAGFGFSPIVNDYKIVRFDLCRLYGIRVYVLQVFSVSTWSWKEENKMLGITPYDIPGFTLDGAIFFLGSRGVGPERCLISFDIAMESFALIPLPRFVHVTIESRLTTYENKLAMLSESRVHSSFSFDLWVMEKCVDTSGERWIWTKRYTSNPFPRPGRPYLLRPLTLWRNEVVIVGSTKGEKIRVLCNLHSNEVKMLARCKYSTGPVIWNYAESLVSIRDIHIEASSS
ncbi:hypothetical protein K1719_018461 [Acacia pycnantha]|nr:hypothetical protein K1719_018461 [Acacia pycnantha]